MDMTAATNIERCERYEGSLLGLAVGDALGTALEFCPPGTFKPIETIQGGGPFRLKAGQWTDDTSMALCLAASLLACGENDPADQMRRYVRWYRQGYMSSTGRCFDIGRTTADALQRFEKSGMPFCGLPDPKSAGNGSIMRLAPVPMFFAKDPVRAIQGCADSSRTTHGAVEAVDACRYFGGLILGALQGVAKEELLSELFSPVAGLWEQVPLTAGIREVAVGSFKNKKPPMIQGSGYVVRSLEAALWAFYATENYREGLLAAVNLGDDADTTGAVYGQLAGAFYGVDGIPGEWREVIHEKQEILNMARQLAEAASKYFELAQETSNKREKI